MAKLKLSADTLRVRSFVIPAGSPDPLTTTVEPGTSLSDDASVTSCTLGPDCASMGPDRPC